MADRCAFCGRDPYEYVDVGAGCVPVAVTCCELGCAVYGRRDQPESELTICAGDLSDIAGTIGQLQWQIQRRDRLIEKLWNKRRAQS